MTELLFTVCLAASPNVCEERSLQYVDLSPRTCVMAAQPELARWAGEHPGWDVQRWSCRIAGLSHDA
jgi:hypothetical protein